MTTTIHNGKLPTWAPDWDKMERTLEQLQTSYFKFEDVEFRRMLCQMQIEIDNLREVTRDRPEEGCLVYTPRSAEIQTEAV